MAEPNETGRGYAHPGYAASLHEFGAPLPLTGCGGSLIERDVPGAAASDAMGPYPLFCCADWSALAADLDELEGALVSVVLVADPVGGVEEPTLREVFRDHVVPYKRHFIRDLDAPAALPTHHRRHIRRASAAVTVEVCSDPLQHLDDWMRLYAALAARHRLVGVRAFSRDAFRRQFLLPGFVGLRAQRGGATVGMTLWFEDGPKAYYHLAAYAPEGYDVSASYALFVVALEHLADRGVRQVDLGGAAGPADIEDGLTRFKRGWANEERMAQLCGRILDRRWYDHLSAGRPPNWFPRYRAADAPAVRPTP